jgi:hypothetical protein
VPTKARLVGSRKAYSRSVSASTRPLPTIGVSRRHAWLLGIEVRPMLSEALLHLDVCQRKPVHEHPGVVRVGEQTLGSCS